MSDWLDNAKRYYRDRGWGYVIYRTVYTAQSDSQWRIAISTLIRLSDKEIDEHNEISVRGDTGPQVAQDMKDFRRFDLRDDREKFNNASMDDLRKHYQQWMEDMAQPGICIRGMDPRAKAFLVIDEECLNSIISAPEELSWEEKENHFVKIVDTVYEQRYAEPWDGWFRLSIYTLWWMFCVIEPDEDIEL